MLKKALILHRIFARTANYIAAASLLLLAANVLLLFVVVVALVKLLGDGGIALAAFDKLIDGGLGLLDEPINRLAGAIVAEAVLNIVELDGNVGEEANATVSRNFGGADLAMSIFSSHQSHKVATLHLHNLPTTTFSVLISTNAVNHWSQLANGLFNRHYMKANGVA
ncbi:hypothetical protein ACLOJK_038675 [Asimina triloba]